MTYRIPPLAEINAFAGMNGRSVISTFSGCGGSSLGYKMAGFKVLVACEFIKEAVEVYALNHPGTVIVDRDIRKVSGQELLDLAGLTVGDLDLFDGSPPCQSFSAAGLREKAWGKTKQYSGAINQRSDDLFFEYIRLVDEIQPKVFIAENVSGLTWGTAQGYFKEIYTALQSAGPGYAVGAQLVDAQYLGIPQKRARIIFIGVRKDLNRSPIFPLHLPIETKLREAIADIPEPFPPLADFKKTKPKDRDYDYLQLGTRTRRAWDYTDVIRDKGCFRHAYQRLFNKDARYMWFKLSPAEPCPTITAKIATLFRWDIPRSLSIAEIKRLSSFPDDFQLAGTFKQKWERIGRAVPPVMMGFIADAILKGVFDDNRETLIDRYKKEILNVAP